ncbi:UNVERIFIED_CONTAM: hypothetical protein Sindi_1320000, partial [Sesamum indicum]
HIIRGRRGICLISDRHAGITRVVREYPDFVSPNDMHRYCLRHVCSNFNSKHKNIVLKDLCWKAGSEYQIRKFNRIMDEIKSQSLEVFQWLDRIDKEKWTASHDGGWRCGILTTNMSECINGVLKGVRRLPLTAIAEMTFQRSVHHFRENHAQKVCAAYMINAALMVKDYYDIMAYKNTYSKSFEPVHSKSYWDVPGFELVHDPTIRISSRPGPNQTTHIHNEMDWAQMRARQQAQQRNSSTQSDVSVPGNQN